MESPPRSAVGSTDVDEGEAAVFDINAWEAVIIIVVALAAIGPERLPDYAARLGRLVRRGKAMADSARGQLREQLGPEYDDINWRAYDPRQYDPRRIVREALLDPTATTDGTAAPAAPPQPPPGQSHRPAVRDVTRPTPYDEDAT